MKMINAPKEVKKMCKYCINPNCVNNSCLRPVDCEVGYYG